jgi:GTP-binding protein Era
VNKIDRVSPRAALLPFLERAAARHDFAAIVPCRRSSGTTSTLLRATIPLLPEGAPEEAPPPARARRALQAAEALREQLMIALSDELPYGLAVEIERYETLADGRIESTR